VRKAGWHVDYKAATASETTRGRSKEGNRFTEWRAEDPAAVVGCRERGRRFQGRRRAISARLVAQSGSAATWLRSNGVSQRPGGFSSLTALCETQIMGRVEERWREARKGFRLFVRPWSGLMRVLGSRLDSLKQF
jgi:hypothetical protein